MGRRISFLLSDIPPRNSVQINITHFEVDPEAAQDAHDNDLPAPKPETLAEVIVECHGVTCKEVFTLFFHEGVGHLERDFNAWGSGYKSTQQIVNMLGVPYSVC